MFRTCTRSSPNPVASASTYVMCVIPSSALASERLETTSFVPFEPLAVSSMRSWSKPWSRRMNAIRPRWIVGSRSASAGELSFETFASDPVATEHPVPPRPARGLRRRRQR
jgi:hypothetical protein